MTGAGARVRAVPSASIINAHCPMNEVVERIRATGRDYNARVETVMREALSEGKL